MFHFIRSSTHRWTMTLAMAAAGSSWAQAPAPAYESAFDGYRGFADQPVGAWPAANRDAADIGGWRAYAKAARAPANNGGLAPAHLQGNAPATLPDSGHSSHQAGSHAGDSPHAGHAGHTAPQAGSLP